MLTALTVAVCPDAQTARSSPHQPNSIQFLRLCRVRSCVNPLGVFALSASVCVEESKLKRARGSLCVRLVLVVVSSFSSFITSLSTLFDTVSVALAAPF